MAAIAVVLAREELVEYIIRWADEFKSKFGRYADVYVGLRYLINKFRSFIDEYKVQTMIVYKGTLPGEVRCFEIYSDYDFRDFVLSDLGIPLEKLFR